MNLTIPFGNVTDPGVSMITKVDIASGGTLTLMIHVIVFLLILGAFYKKSNNPIIKNFQFNNPSLCL